MTKCPECIQGKPLNCAGVALNEDDEFVTCDGGPGADE